MSSPTVLFRPRLTCKWVILGRDPDWINLNIQHTLSVAKGALIVRLFPTFLKPYVASTRPYTISFLVW